MTKEQKAAVAAVFLSNNYSGKIVWQNDLYNTTNGLKKKVQYEDKGREVPAVILVQKGAKKSRTTFYCGTAILGKNLSSADRLT